MEHTLLSARALTSLRLPSTQIMEHTCIVIMIEMITFTFLVLMIVTFIYL